MERAIDSLKYEGSISDAILEAKAQKKLLAVYISCEDENWLKWEQSTFAHPLVVEFISKYCVFLHLISGSLGSSQFSAIYPQKGVPSISVVGYTGVLLWHESCFMDDGEGYVDARDIVNSFHKALATLHLQGLECLDSSISDGQTNTSEKLLEHSEHGQCSPESSQITPNQVEGRIEDKKDDDHPVMFNEGDVSLEPQGNIPSDKSTNKTSETAVVVMSSCSPGSSQITTYQVEERSEAKKGDDLADYSNTTIPKDIHLHIRMPTGAMLQASFDMADTLRSVKNYIDKNQSGTGSYDLAVTYPRKVFSEQDMTSPLSELGLARRQSLLVVPRKATEHVRGLSLSRSEYPVSGTDSGNINGGYFRHVKWILSYMNPFSYFGSEAAPNEPNPTIQNQLPGTETSSRTVPPNRQNSRPGNNANNPRGRASNSRPFGSNIHTLRESEDEDPSADRNMFWNGNSTQYGGDDKK